MHTKLAAPHSFLFQLVNTPLSKVNFLNKQIIVTQIAKINGYRYELVDKLQN